MLVQVIMKATSTFSSYAFPMKAPVHVWIFNFFCTQTDLFHFPWTFWSATLWKEKQLRVNGISKSSCRDRFNEQQQVTVETLLDWFLVVMYKGPFLKHRNQNVVSVHGNCGILCPWIRGQCAFSADLASAIWSWLTLGGKPPGISCQG